MCLQCTFCASSCLQDCQRCSGKDLLAFSYRSVFSCALLLWLDWWLPPLLPALSCLQDTQPLGAFLAGHSRALGGQALVGRGVCLDWGGHNAGPDDEGPGARGWYAGRLVAYDPASGEYTVRRWWLLVKGAAWAQVNVTVG